MKKKKKTITRRSAGTTKRKAVVKKTTSKKQKRAHSAPKQKTLTKRVHKFGGDKIPKSAASLQLLIGSVVPEFTIKGTNGLEMSLSKLKGKNVVLYFYPKDSTPGCTREGHEFTKLHPEFSKNNTEVFGISRDSLSSHERFKNKENYCFDLISDESGEISNIFGVWKEKQNYGRTYFGIERSTFIIDANGILRKEWRGVKVDGHAAEVLNAIKEL